jgi:hypothetical protein
MKQLIELAILVCVLSPALQAQPVYFADANLKAAVESKLGVTNPTTAQMVGLTALVATSSNIGSLTGLEYAGNLEHLVLSHNRISDLSPLRKLKNLEHLFIHDNQIADLSPLSGLTKLLELGLDENEISSVSALAGLTTLKYLGLRGNRISNIALLTGLTNLQVLRLADSDGLRRVLGVCGAPTARAPAMDQPARDATPC